MAGAKYGGEAGLCTAFKECDTALTLRGKMGFLSTSGLVLH